MLESRYTEEQNQFSDHTIIQLLITVITIHTINIYYNITS